MYFRWFISVHFTLWADTLIFRKWCKNALWFWVLILKSNYFRKSCTGFLQLVRKQQFCICSCTSVQGIVMILCIESSFWVACVGCFACVYRIQQHSVAQRIQLSLWVWECICQPCRSTVRCNNRITTAISWWYINSWMHVSVPPLEIECFRSILDACVNTGAWNWMFSINLGCMCQHRCLKLNVFDQFISTLGCIC